MIAALLVASAASAAGWSARRRCGVRSASAACARDRQAEGAARRQGQQGRAGQTHGKIPLLLQCSVEGADRESRSQSRDGFVSSFVTPVETGFATSSVLARVRAVHDRAYRLRRGRVQRAPQPNGCAGGLLRWPRLRGHVAAMPRADDAPARSRIMRSTARRPSCCRARPASPRPMRRQQPDAASAQGNDRRDALCRLSALGRCRVWADPEIDQGFGLSNTLGVAGFPSAEAYKVGKKHPYLRLQRAFFRQTIDLGGASETDTRRRPTSSAARDRGPPRAHDRQVRRRRRVRHQ